MVVLAVIVVMLAVPIILDVRGRKKPIRFAGVDGNIVLFNWIWLMGRDYDVRYRDGYRDVVCRKCDVMIVADTKSAKVKSTPYGPAREIKFYCPKCGR
jgi:hypothetical protein